MLRYILLLALCITTVALAEGEEDIPDEEQEFDYNEDDEDDEENESGENDQEEEDIEKDRDLEEEDAEHNPYGYNSHYDHNGPTVNELLHKVKDYLVIERNLHNLEMTCTCETKDDMKDKNVHYWDNSAKSYYPVKKALRIRRPQLKCRCHAAPFFWLSPLWPSPVAESFKRQEIVPDVIDVAPKELVKVTYGHDKVNLGNILTPTQVKDRPKVSFAAKHGEFYTLLMTGYHRVNAIIPELKGIPLSSQPTKNVNYELVKNRKEDPDAPSRKDPKFREFFHWLVVNIPGNDVPRGEEVFEYIGSGPPKGTGLHRYVFLVYKQKGRINFTDPIRTRTLEGRPNQKAREVEAKYNLGKPVAGNFYQAEWDEFVPKLVAELEQNLKEQRQNNS